MEIVACICCFEGEHLRGQPESKAKNNDSHAGLELTGS